MYCSSPVHSRFVAHHCLNCMACLHFLAPTLDLQVDAITEGNKQLRKDLDRFDIDEIEVCCYLCNPGPGPISLTGCSD